MRLTDFKALAFDCYGTLIDWEAGMLEQLTPLAARATKRLSPDEILQAHARHESSQQAQTPNKKYYDLLAIVYKRLAEEWQVSVSHEECVVYGNSVEHWPAFPDSRAALDWLKKHYKLIILSNVDNRSFSASNEKLGVAFDAIYTAEDVGSYKPASGNFDYMLEQVKPLGLGRDDILHTAESLFHDHAPANQFGLTSCWIYRRHDREGFGATMDPGEMPKIDFQFNSMADLVSAHQNELAGN